MEPTLLDLFDDRQKAIDHALWLNFKYRIAKIRFGVIHGPERGWAVCEEATANEMGICFLNVMPKDHSKMGYRDIRHIRMDREPLPHWEAITGMFSVADGEILRYLLYAKIPIEMFIRYELAARGYDKDHRWCGFDKAEKIWLE